MRVATQGANSSTYLVAVTLVLTNDKFWSIQLIEPFVIILRFILIHNFYGPVITRNASDSESSSTLAPGALGQQIQTSPRNQGNKYTCQCCWHTLPV